MTAVMAAIVLFPGEPGLASAAQSRDRDVRPARENAVNRDWLAKLDHEDRAPLEAIQGYALPPLTGDIRWANVSFLQPPQWSQFEGDVIVIQSWTHEDEAAVAAMRESIEAMRPLAPMDVRVIALHTPDGAANLEAYLDANPIEHAWVAVDTTGAFCDRLGIYRSPVNVVVDRGGAIRFGGLSAKGLTPAVLSILEEVCEPGAPEPQPVPVGLAQGATAEFPEATGSTGRTPDHRGRVFPEFTVSEWITKEPLTKDKLVLVEFWATWCGYCIKAISHLNALADEFRGEVQIIALTDEPESRLTTGLQRRNLGADSFSYAVGLDPSGKLKRQLGVRGIPHAYLVSSDGVVRWQGHPAALNAATLRRYVEANRALAREAGRRSWQAE